MKTLVNKANPQIRITAPEITQWVESAYVVGRHLSETEDVRDIALVIPKKDWTLVEEEPEVNFKVKERKWVHDAVDNVFPEDGDFMSEVDFRKIIKDTARHFYELGLKARKEE